MRTPRLLSAVLALATCFLAPTATAFDSVPAGSSVHDDLTAIAKETGWGADAVDDLQEAVRDPDFTDSTIDPDADHIAKIDATDAYRPEHHCDRVPPAADAEAFGATVAYIQQQRTNATQRMAANDVDGAVDALGRALHAFQDCYSHSNVVDLPDQQSAFEQALLKGGTAPPGLRLTGFAPHTDDPEDPPGDPYPHKAMAKDSQHKGDEAEAKLADGTTKFDMAVQLARMGTVAFLQEFVHSLPPEQQAALMRPDPDTGSDGTGDPHADDEGMFDVPGPSVGLLVAALALCAVAGRRRL